jgi:hypothetical protein
MISVFIANVYLQFLKSSREEVWMGKCFAVMMIITFGLLSCHAYSAIDTCEIVQRSDPTFGFLVPPVTNEEVGVSISSSKGIGFIAPSSYPALSSSTLSFTTPENSLAYRILRDLAEKKNRERITQGAIQLGVGIAGAIIIGALESQLWSPPWVSIVVGGTYTLGGVITLMTPTEVEREYAKIEQMDPLERENYSLMCLQRLAQAGYTKRMYEAVFNIATGAAWFLWGLYQPSFLWYLIGASSIATGVYNFLVLSEEEAALKMYQQLKGTASLQSVIIKIINDLNTHNWD